MQWTTIIILSIGLAVDAVAASVSLRASSRMLLHHSLRTVLLFGGFQSGMAALGVAVGKAASDVAGQWDHWIAFALLAGLGIRSMVKSWRNKDEPTTKLESSLDHPSWSTTFALAIATSIDALAVGVSLPALKVPVTLTVVSIGVITAALSGLGLIAGGYAQKVIGRHADFLAGAILFLIGCQMLMQHLMQGI